MDEIAALTPSQRDDLHRGIRAAMKNEPYDEHETTCWRRGHEFYRSCSLESTQANAELN